MGLLFRFNVRRTRHQRHGPSPPVGVVGIRIVLFEASTSFTIRTQVRKSWACTLAKRDSIPPLSSSASTAAFRPEPAFGVAIGPRQPGPKRDLHPQDYRAIIAHPRI